MAAALVNGWLLDRLLGDPVRGRPVAGFRSGCSGYLLAGFRSGCSGYLLAEPPLVAEPTAERRPAAALPDLDEGYIRVTVRPPADNAQLLATLDAVLMR